MNTSKSIQLSSELKDVLLQFADNSAIARILLQSEICESQLKSSDIDYLGVSSLDKSKISYLTHDRIQKISQEEVWTSPKRYHQKPGALISKLLKNITGKEVENFSNLFRAFSDKKDFEFEIIKGEKIKNYYHESSYASVSGSLGNSCMRYSKCSKFFNLYSDNKVEMLVMLDKFGSLLGRALLWNCGEYKIMDRIYTVSDEDFLFYFTFWADKNDYYHKKRQNWSNTLQFIKNGLEEELKLQYKLDSSNYSYYPYIDTFKWIDFESGTLFNYKPEYFKNNSNFGVLLSSEGSINSSSCLIFDSVSKDWHHDGTLLWIDYLEIYTQDVHVVFSESNDTHILKTDAVWSEELFDFIFKEPDRNNIEAIIARTESLNKLKKNKSDIEDSLDLDPRMLNRLLGREFSINVN